MEILKWNAIKKELWKLNVSDLQIKLQEILTERQKVEVTVRIGHKKRQVYHEKDKFNLKNLNKRIACIKTMLHVKLAQPR